MRLLASIALLAVSSLPVAACAGASHAPPVRVATATTAAPPPASASAPPASPWRCRFDEHQRAARSAELARLRDEDQAARKRMPSSPAEWAPIEDADRRRRMRVGEIFGEGCMTTAKDFANGALIYQHGDQPEHYLQAFFWASRAAALGDPSQKSMMALAVDRYLVESGKKQLFGSQATRAYGAACFCMYPVEPSFPEEERVRWGKPLAEQRAWIAEMNKSTSQGASCPEVECAMPLAPTPRGSVPGLW